MKGKDVKNIEEKQNETYRLIQWITKHWEEWELLCGLTRKEIKASELRKILESLVNESLYQIALVAITAGYWYFPVSQAIEKCMFTKIADSWEDETLKELIHQVNTEIQMQLVPAPSQNIQENKDC